MDDQKTSVKERYLKKSNSGIHRLRGDLISQPQTELTYYDKECFDGTNLCKV